MLYYELVVWSNLWLRLSHNYYLFISRLSPLKSHVASLCDWWLEFEDAADVSPSESAIPFQFFVYLYKTNWRSIYIGAPTPVLDRSTGQVSRYFKCLCLMPVLFQNKQRRKHRKFQVSPMGSSGQCVDMHPWAENSSLISCSENISKSRGYVFEEWHLTNPLGLKTLFQEGHSTDHLVPHSSCVEVLKMHQEWGAWRWCSWVRAVFDHRNTVVGDSFVSGVLLCWASRFLQLCTL